MKEMLISEEIRDRMDSSQIKYMSSGVSAVILFITGFALLSYNKDIIFGVLIFISIILMIFSAYYIKEYNKYNKCCSFEKINKLRECIEPYPDLQAEFKKRSAKGFLLTIEYHAFMREISMKENYRTEKALQ